VKKTLAIVLSICAAAALLGACGKTEGGGNGPMPLITIIMEDGGVIKAELYPDKAPNTVNNFISLANSGWFEGKVFHRAVAGMMIQGGSPNGDGMSAGFPYSIKGEFANNGFTQNDLKHTRGVLSMARTGIPDSAGCQFFIMHGVYPSLDNEYATFGKVTSGMDVVDKIATSPVTGPQRDQLVAKPAIKSVTADLNGYEYAEPVTIPAQQAPVMPPQEGTTAQQQEGSSTKSRTTTGAPQDERSQE